MFQMSRSDDSETEHRSGNYGKNSQVNPPPLPLGELKKSADVGKFP